VLKNETTLAKLAALITVGGIRRLIKNTLRRRIPNPMVGAKITMGNCVALSVINGVASRSLLQSNNIIAMTVSMNSIRGRTILHFMTGMIKYTKSDLP
jgi:hypothetical protein